MIAKKLNEFARELKSGEFDMEMKAFGVELDDEVMDSFIVNFDMSEGNEANIVEKPKRLIPKGKRALKSKNDENITMLPSKIPKYHDRDFVNHQKYSVMIEEKHGKNGDFVELSCERKNMLLLTRKVNKVTIIPKDGADVKDMVVNIERVCSPEYIKCYLDLHETKQSTTAEREFIITKLDFEIDYQSKRKEMKNGEKQFKRRSEEVIPVVYSLIITHPDDIHQPQEILIGIFRRAGDSTTKRINKVLKEYRKEKFRVNIPIPISAMG